MTVSKPGLLVTGASGLLGWQVCRIARDAGWEVSGCYHRHPVGMDGVRMSKLDLMNSGDLENFLNDLRPQAIIHCAAASDPNSVEREAESSQRLNVGATLELARWCLREKRKFVFTSTDLVFDGMKGHYREDDRVNPIMTYGLQKVEAENFLLEHPDLCRVCRMPLMIGPATPGSNSFMSTMAENFGLNKKVRLFHDEFRTPVHTVDAAVGLLLALGQKQPLLHLGGSERFSRVEMGEILAQSMGLSSPPIESVAQAEVQMAARRPPDVSLDSSLAQGLGYRPRRMRDYLSSLLQP